MDQAKIADTLGRLLHILCRSLPMYLEEARPWTRRDDQPAQRALANLVADQRMFSGRVAQTILDLDGNPALGRFPTAFTSLHDLSIEFLMPRIVECQRRDLQAIEQCVHELAGTPMVRPLAEEILGNARGHLDILDALVVGEGAGRT